MSRKKIFYTVQIVLLLLVVMIAIFLFQTGEEERVRKEEKKKLQSTPLLGDSSFWTRREDLKFLVEVDVNLWLPYVSGTTYGFLSKSGSTVAPCQGTALKMPFHWRFGFDAAFGVQWMHSDWMLSLEYTYFQDREEKMVLASKASTIVPVKGVFLQGESVKAAESHLKVLWNNLDLSTDKTFHLKEDILLDAILGIRNSWMEIVQNTKFTGGPFLGQNQFTVSNSSKFWGIGPKLGMSGKWLFIDSFYLRGLLDGILQYGTNRIRYKESLGKTGLLEISLKDLSQNIAPSCDLEAGVGMAKYVNEGKQLITWDLSYVVHYFWNQNQFLSVETNPGITFTEEDKDVSFQGFSFKLGVRY